MRQFLVINKRNLPTRMPVSGTLLIILALDHWNAPWWMWLIGGLLLFYRWSVVAYRLRYQKEYDLFPESVKDVELQDRKSQFEKIIRDSSQ